MKLNQRMYKNILTEPFMVQEIRGKQVSFHYLNETSFYNQSIMQGRFATWTSDGKDFKILVEKGYYEESKEFYSEEINGVWIDFFAKAGNENKRLLKVLFLPVVLAFIVALLVFMFVPPLKPFLTHVAIIGMVGLLFLNFFQSSTLKKKYEVFTNETHAAIHDILGDDGVEELIKKQEAYREKFYDDLQKEYETEEEKLAREEAEKEIAVEETELLSEEIVEVETVVEDNGEIQDEQKKSSNYSN